MSKSNASAKNRRAFVDTRKLQNTMNRPTPIQQTPNQQVSQPNQTPTTGLTIQQVVAILDRRLGVLETFMKESKEAPERGVKFDVEENSGENVSNNLEEIISEFNSRFDILAEEVGNLKEIVLKLQTYTMDVNKVLIEKHIPSLSDLGANLTLDSIQENDEDNNGEVVDSPKSEIDNTLESTSTEETIPVVSQPQGYRRQRK